MKKKYIILIVLCVLFVGYVLTSIGVNKYKERKSYEEAVKNSSYYKNCQIINDYNTNIMLLGDMFEGNKYLTFNQIYNLDDVNVEPEYNVLIINDLSSNIELEESDYYKLYELVYSSKNILFMYFGDSKINKLKEHNIVTINTPQEYIGFLVCNQLLKECCIMDKSFLDWMKTYNKTFEEELCYDIASFIKDLN